MRPYSFQGRKNLKITFNADSNFLHEHTAEVSLSQRTEKCALRFLGGVELSNHQAIQIATPVNADLVVRVTSDDSGITTENVVENQLYWHVIENRDYELAVREEKGSQGIEIYERIGERSRRLDLGVISDLGCR